jgi:GTP 3',8-cyclase
LPKYAEELADLGVRRINVSLDTLKPNRFQAITRWGSAQHGGQSVGAAVCGLHTCPKVHTRLATTNFEGLHDQ